MGNRKTQIVKFIKRYSKLMGNVISALSILFVLAALVQPGFDVGQVTDWRLFLPACTAGVLLKAFTVFLSGSAWGMWLEYVSGKHCSRPEALRVYAKANIGKYLPGNVMHYVERNLFAGKLGLSQKQVTAASLLEVGNLLAAAVILAAAMALPWLHGQDWGLAWQNLYVQELLGKGKGMMLGAAAILAAALVIFVSGKYSANCKARTPGYAFRKHPDAAGFLRAFLKGALVYAAVLAVLGILLVIAYICIGGRPSLHEAMLMVSAYVAAWVLGFVIPGSPGGIGVRELALTLLLSPILGQGAVVSLSILHRMVTVAGDFMAYLFRNAFAAVFQ